jgi:2-C-methyl-D-erythritol 4-phosphate cytidylyltransferase
MKSAAIFLAAGCGSRMRGRVDDKSLALLNGKPAIVYSLEAFSGSEIVDHYIVVYRDDVQRSRIEAIIQEYGLEKLSFQCIQGGSERQLSVTNALEAIPEDCEYVFIHDCARPCIHSGALAELHTAVQVDQAACLAHPVCDTIKRAATQDELRRQKLEDLDRSRLWAMETPQAFALKSIREAYQKVIRDGLSVTDDTAAAETIGLRTTLVPNDRPNPKLTTPSDLDYIEHLLTSNT